MFHLQLVRENNNTQISLSFIDLDRKINSSDYCENCNTMDLVNLIQENYRNLKKKLN